MKKINLIKRLWTDSHEKQSPQRFARYAAMLLLLLTCVTHAWAGDGFYGIYIKYNQNGTAKTSDGEWTSPLAVGTLTADFKVTDVYLKVWWSDWSPSMSGQLHYWKDGNEGWSGTFNNVKDASGDNNHEVYIEDWDYSLASTTEASGDHTITYKWEAYFSSVTHTLPSDGTKTITYSVSPPALSGSDFTVTPSNLISGTGSSSDPFIIANNSSTTFTVSATQAHTDAKSALWAKFGSNSYSSTLTSESYAKSASKTSVTIKAKYRNNDKNGDGTPGDGMDGTEVTKTIYYQEQPAGITVTAGSNGTVSVDGSSYGSSKVITPIDLGEDYNIYATANSYYHFVNWSTDNANASFGDDEEANTTVNVSSGAVTTVTASFAETKSTLTTSNSYSAGNPGYAVPSKSVSSIGYYTTANLTATAAGTGYTFTGWTLTNCTRTDGGAANSRTITIRANGDGAAATARANYTEDLTSSWTLKGGTNLTGDNWSTSHAMTKKTGHSTESVAYYTLNITSTNSGVSTGTDSWSFKLYNSGWYGLTADGESYWWTSSTSANQSLNGSGKNIQVCANALGEYEVKVDWSSGDKVTVSFPTSYAVNFGKGGTSGSSTVTAKYSNVAFSTGTKVQSGKKVVFTYSEATGYHFVEWNTRSDGAGSSLGTAASYEYTVGTSNNVYAIFAPNTWTVTLDAEGGTAYGITESVSVTYNAITNLTSAITKPSTHPAFSTFGGYWTGRGGTGVQLIDKDGNWIKDVASYTGHSSTNPTWIYNNNITLYAKWTLYYSLHHSPNLTNTAESSGGVTVTYKSSTLTGFTASSRSGYECQGYYTTTNAAGGGQKVITSGGALFNTNGASDTIVDTSNKWIYATRRINGGYLYPHWTANTYTVKFNGNCHNHPNWGYQNNRNKTKWDINTPFYKEV